MLRKLRLAELGRPSAADFRQAEKLPFVLLLDNVRSALNVGSVFRTADGFAAAEVALCGITAQPPHREILKTALGATETVEWRYFPEVLEAAAFYQSRGFRLLVVEQTTASVPLDVFIEQLNVNQPVVAVLGNEVDGVSEGLLPLADACVEIPQLGAKHSLNVAVCGGIVGWELFKRFRANAL